MNSWRSILLSLPKMIAYPCSVMDVFKHFSDKEHILFLCDEEKNILGYVNQIMLMEQLAEDKDQVITYGKDILKVPEKFPIEFYHNISVIIGTDNDGNVSGYTTTEDARVALNHIKLQQFNQIFNSSGTGIITINSNFDITFINETAEKILGLSKSFLLYRNYKKLLTMNKDLEEVLSGKQFLSVRSSINFKEISGNFSPLYENNRITGIVHFFSTREHFEEAAKELEFVRDLNEDLKAIYSSANEQIIVVNHKEEIIRIAGTFLKEFWGRETPEELVGQSITSLEKERVFQPNIVELCKIKKGKLSLIQESHSGRKIWSTANPVFNGESIEKIVILSRDITEMSQIREELESEKRKSKIYKQELNELLSKQGEDKKLIYRSRIMENLVDELKHIAKVDSTVLLIGESGVGKEVFARTIHEQSPRRKEQFVRVNCGAIPENLMESELFGYEKGAFTGADQKGKLGLFELAHKGSIFLDEITELPLSLQVKLLRVLQEREIMRVGGTTTVKIDVRIIAATNRNIKQLVMERKFREDLYYRLNVIPIEIPPLRKRQWDIAPLTAHFINKYNKLYRIEKNLTREALEALEGYHWPGNVRELQNIIERLSVTTRAKHITDKDVLEVLYHEKIEQRKVPLVQEIIPLKEAVKEVEQQLITLAMQKFGTASRAAEVLGVSQATISRRINGPIQ